MTLLHLADLHLTDRTEARVAWVRALAQLQPDIVVNTGDNLSFASGLEPLGRALEPFLHLPGAFVMGDHDYRTTVFRLPTRYLHRDPRKALVACATRTSRPCLGSRSETSRPPPAGRT